MDKNEEIEHCNYMFSKILEMIAQRDKLNAEIKALQVLYNVAKRSFDPALKVVKDE